jgi:hypothetical protein
MRFNRRELSDPKPTIPKSIFGLLLLLSVSLVSFASNMKSLNAANADDRWLRHVVQFQFKSSSSESDVNGVIDAFRALPKKISAVADFEYGTDNSPEGLADGFTHCFFLTFRSEADRKNYLEHTEHQAFVAILKPHLEKVQVIDYWAAK